MSRTFIQLTAGEAVELKDSREWTPVWIKAADIVAVREHFFTQTWAGRIFATVNGAVVHLASMPGMPVHVRETPEEVVMLVSEAGE